MGLGFACFPGEASKQAQELRNERISAAVAIPTTAASSSL